MAEITGPEHEQPQTPELLNHEGVGLQAALLLDARLPEKGQGINRTDLSLTRAQIENHTPPDNTKITNSSYLERDEHWNKEGAEFKDDFDKQKEVWIQKSNAFLSGFKDKPQQGILIDKFGIDIENGNGAEAFYKEYFEEKQGNVGYFALQVSRLTPEQLKEAREEVLDITGPNGAAAKISLLDTLGRFYGLDSAMVAGHLSDAMINVKNNQDNFTNEADSQFNAGEDMQGYSILEGINEKNTRWLAKKNLQTEPQIPQRTQPDIKPDETQKAPEPQPGTTQNGPQEIPEPKQPSIETRQSLDQQTEQLVQKISQNQFASNFIPVLESFKQPDIPDEDYASMLKSAQNVFDQILLKEDSDKRGKSLAILDLYDSIYENSSSANTLNNKNLGDKYTEITGKFEDLLKEQQIARIRINIGDPLDEAIMRKARTTDSSLLSVPNNTVSYVDKQGFTLDNDILRQADIALFVSSPETVPPSPDQLNPAPLRPDTNREQNEEPIDDSPLNEEELQLAAKFMAYEDVGPPATPEELTKSFNVDRPNARYYVRELKNMLSEYSENLITEKAKQKAEELVETLKILGIDEPSYVFSNSSMSGYIWYAARERFRAKHPAQSQMPDATEGYPPYDPLLQYKEGITEEEERQSKLAELQVTNIMLGSEAYGQKRKENGIDVTRSDGILMPPPELENLLNEQPQSGTSLLSLDKLARIGSLINSHIRRDIPSGEQDE